MTQSDTMDFLQFLDNSPTCYHAVANLAAELTRHSYTVLSESDRWQLSPGGSYFVTRGGSSLLAFRIPDGNIHGFQLAAGHSDSPTLKLRQNAEVPSAGDCLRLSVEPYGGGIWRSWMDCPLSVAGRVMTAEDNGTVRSRLVNVDRDLLSIPSLAIHMNREVNKNGGLDVSKDLLPLFGCGKAGQFQALIAQTAGVPEERLLSTELFLYPRTKATRVGVNEEFVLSPRLDDLQCVYGCFQGFLMAQASESIPVLCVFNNEEVGSGTRQGADSTFLTDILQRISAGLHWDSEQSAAALANSFLVSADNAHAVHPAHPEYADANESPRLNGGIVLKYNAAQRYTTDAFSAALFLSLCRKADVPVQRYSNRADLPGGFTLGNISTAHLSVPSVDIGLPQLAMHSACELAGAQDTDTLVKAMTAYFSASFRRLPDGTATF